MRNVPSQQQMDGPVGLWEISQEPPYLITALPERPGWVAGSSLLFSQNSHF